MTEEVWRPVSEAPETRGTYINVRVPPDMAATTYRWIAYKPDGARQMGRPGRWQVTTHEMGGWRNAELPKNGEFVLNLPIVP